MKIKDVDYSNKFHFLPLLKFFLKVADWFASQMTRENLFVF